MGPSKGLLLAGILALSCGTLGSSAQIFVTIRPARIATVRPSPPHAGYIWIEEDWRENDGRYEWSGGRWEAPPRQHDVYRAGHWSHTNRGDRWVRGGWSQRRNRPPNNQPTQNYQRHDEHRDNHRDNHDNGGGHGRGHGKGK